MNDPLGPEQVKAARSLLAWSQQELANAARVSISTVADFERGFRTPVVNNAQAIQEAFEKRGLQFFAGGVVDKTLLPAPPQPLRPGCLMRWINATHLSQWGESRDGQCGMPELIRRLIYAAMGPAAEVRFPSDESVQYSGWDGICTVATGVAPIPDGTSGWEIGAQRRGIGGKADGDFAKRSKDSLGLKRETTTFVFATPQRFPGKDAWAAEKRALGLWRDVRVIDADDLVLWLETYPAVAQWLAVKIGRRPNGLLNLEEIWSEWTSATRTLLTEDVILTDRDDHSTAILKWLKGPPGLFSIQAEAPEEAIAFLYASISALPEPYRVFYWSRTVVAADENTARDLIGLGSPLIIVLMNPDPGVARRLADDGHHVYTAHGPEAIACSHRLARPWRHNIQTALVRAGTHGRGSA